MTSCNPWLIQHPKHTKPKTRNQFHVPCQSIKSSFFYNKFKKKTSPAGVCVCAGSLYRPSYCVRPLIYSNKRTNYNPLKTAINIYIYIRCMKNVCECVCWEWDRGASQGTPQRKRVDAFEFDTKWKARESWCRWWSQRGSGMGWITRITHIIIGHDAWYFTKTHTKFLYSLGLYDDHAIPYFGFWIGKPTMISSMISPSMDSNSSVYTLKKQCILPPICWWSLG